MPKVGAHVSAAGNISLSLDRALELGAQCTQIFISPPQQWAQILPPEQIIEEYQRKTENTQISPNFIHAAYLINLASPNPDLVKKSVNWLIYSQKIAEKLRIVGTIFHIGSFKGTTEEDALKQVVEAIQTILKNSGKANLILENSAGAGNLIGDTFQEIGEIVRRVQDSRIKVCLDTQHAFVSGYQWSSKKETEKTLTEFDKEVGLDKLITIHANDSKTEFNSKRDRHENIGEGFIGLEGFRNIINHPSLKDIPFILEVPGEGQGPDTNNIVRLKSLIK